MCHYPTAKPTCINTGVTFVIANLPQQLCTKSLNILYIQENAYIFTVQSIQTNAIKMNESNGYYASIWMKPRVIYILNVQK